MAITYDLGTSIGQVRFNIGDTHFEDGMGIRPGGEAYTDEEIQYVIDSADGSVSYATYELMTRLATEFAAKATAVEFGAFRQENEDTARNYQRQAMTVLAKLKDEERAGGKRKFTVAHSTAIPNEFIF